MRKARTRELTVEVSFSPQSEDGEAEFYLEGITPKGETPECAYCFGDEDGPPLLGCCDAHATERSIDDVGLEDWIRNTLGEVWLKHQLTRPKPADIRIIGSNVWTSYENYEMDVDVEFDVSNFEVVEISDLAT